MNQLVLKCLVSKQPVTWIVDHNYAGLSTRPFQRKALFIDHYKVTIVEFIIGVHVLVALRVFLVCVHSTLPGVTGICILFCQ